MFQSLTLSKLVNSCVYVHVGTCKQMKLFLFFFIFLIFDLFLQGCVMDALEGKTVILVTHQVEFLPAVDTILVTTF